MERLLSKQEEQYKDQIEILKDALEKAQEGHNSITKLLEDQRAGQGSKDNLESLVKSLEARIANQEKVYSKQQVREDAILKQNKKLKRALAAEKKKGVWKKLFG